MKRWLKRICGLLVLGALGVSGCLQTSPPAVGGKSAEPVVGKEPPEVAAAEWLNTDESPNLADLRGQVVLVEFWATWCGPCVQGIPHLNKLHDQFGKEGLRILSLTDEDRATVERFQRGAKSPIQYTVGAGSTTGDVYGVSGIPHAFLIGRDGKLLWEGHPASPDCDRQIAAALAKK